MEPKFTPSRPGLFNIYLSLSYKPHCIVVLSLNKFNHIYLDFFYEIVSQDVLDIYVRCHHTQVNSQLASRPKRCKIEMARN